MKWYTKLFGVLALGILVGLFMMIATDPGDNVRLVDAGVRTGQSGGRFVTGTLRNNTDRSYSHVQVEINLLDENGSVVGSTVASTSDLGAGETWDIETPVLAENVVRFRMENLICSPSPQSSEWEKKRSCALTYEGLIE
jgi:hypothetical protein